MDELDDLLFDYATRANPKSNEDLKRYLRRRPQGDHRIHRELARALDPREGPATGAAGSRRRAAHPAARTGAASRHAAAPEAWKTDLSGRFRRFETSPVR